MSIMSDGIGSLGDGHFMMTFGDDSESAPTLPPLQDRLHQLRRQNRMHKRNGACAFRTVITCLCLIVILLFSSSFVPSDSIFMNIALWLAGSVSSMIFIVFTALICVLKFKCAMMHREIDQIWLQIATEQETISRMHSEILRTVRMLQTRSLPLNEVEKLNRDMKNMCAIHSLMQCMPVLPEKGRPSYIFSENDAEKVEDTLEKSKSGEIQSEEIKCSSYNAVPQSSTTSNQVHSNQFQDKDYSGADTTSYSHEGEFKQSVESVKSQLLQNSSNSTLQEGKNSEPFSNLSKKVRHRTPKEESNILFKLVPDKDDMPMRLEINGLVGELFGQDCNNAFQSRIQNELKGDYERLNALMNGIAYEQRHVKSGDNPPIYTTISQSPNINHSIMAKPEESNSVSKKANVLPENDRHADISSLVNDTINYDETIKANLLENKSAETQSGEIKYSSCDVMPQSSTAASSQGHSNQFQDKICNGAQTTSYTHEGEFKQSVESVKSKVLQNSPNLTLQEGEDGKHF